MQRDADTTGGLLTTHRVAFRYDEAVQGSPDRLGQHGDVGPTILELLVGHAHHPIPEVLRSAKWVTLYRTL